MRPIYDNDVIQIEITNSCHLSCTHCTRHLGHHRNTYFMDLDTARKAILSLEGFPGVIGIMGGEPAMHPKFSQMLDLWEELVPYEHRGFWTAGFRWGEHADRIKAMFPKRHIHYNDHIAYDGKHTPLLVAIDDVVFDEEFKQQLIENCGFQEHWSASITPKGGFFCEIAASLDWLMEGPGGYPIEPGWWKKTPADFKDQVDRYCGMCSGAIPMPAYTDARGGRDKPNKDVISQSNLDRLTALGSPKIARGDYILWTEEVTREKAAEWDTRNRRGFRTFEGHDPEDVLEAVKHHERAPSPEDIANRFKPIRKSA